MSSNIDERYMKYLNDIKAKEQKLFDRAIFEHYEGCYNLLNDWGYSEYLCLFGLFHSVYDKKIFKNNTPNTKNRKKLASLIGGDLEELIFKWEILNRKEYIFDIIEHPKKQIKNDPIIVMIWANIFEQAFNKKTPTNGKHIFLKTSHLVNEKANLTLAKLIEEGLII